MIKNYLIFTVTSAIIPIIGALLTGGGILVPSATFLFLGLSFISPLVVYRLSFYKSDRDLPFHKGYLIYSWLFWSIFFLLGTVTFQIQLDTSHLGYLIITEFIALLLFLFLEIGTMIGLTKWFSKEERSPLMQWLDLCIYIVPIPFLILGDVLYQKGEQMYQSAYLNFVFKIITIDVYLLVALAMATFAIYLYPKKYRGNRGVGIVRILLTAGLWLVGNVFFLYFPFSQGELAHIYTILPVFSNSILVFITPPIVEMIIIGIAFYGGYLLEKSALFKKKSVV